MSLSSPVPPAGRPLQEQALALVAFLAARDNILTAPQASSALEGLPDDPKPAAKQLRGRLKALGVDIQHTHALKAVAEARGAGGYLGLGEQLQYDVASWSPDSPAVSCERVKLTSFAAAADELCRRVREQYEDDAPYVALHPYADYLLLSATSAMTGTWWRLLLVPVGPQASLAIFSSAGPLVRLAERLRRLVEGQLGGWVDGTYAVPCVLANDGEGPEPSQGRFLWESEFSDRLWFAEDARPEELPTSVPDVEAFQLTVPERIENSLTREQWSDFLKRYTAFFERHNKSLFLWSRELRDATQESNFELVDINSAVLEHARRTATRSWDELWLDLRNFDEDGRVAEELQAGRASLELIQRLGHALGVDPNDLLTANRVTPRIPLPHHTDLALWLSRMEAVVSQPEGAAPVAAGLVNHLKALCAVPYEKRRTWDKRPPAELEALNQEIRFAGLMVCAGMGVRFVQDLPLGWTRPASVSLFEFDWQADVLTQGGQLDAEHTSMVIGPERDPVTPEWLARFNKPHFTASDLLRYSDMVHKTIGEEEEEKDRFTAKVFAGIKVFNRDPEKAHSASVRMEALSRLIKQEAMEPWVRRSRDTEKGALMISEAAFEATARCELVDVNGEPGFDRQAFYMLCVKHSRKYS